MECRLDPASPVDDDFLAAVAHYVRDPKPRLLGSVRCILLQSKDRTGIEAEGGAMAKRRTGLPVEFAQAPMRTVRPADAAAVYAHPGSQMVRLERLGLLHKVAVGYYVVVPQERIGTDWRPTIEAAAAGVATAALGAGRAVLMGVSAARLHNVVPRALGIAIVAVPDDRRDIVLRDRDGLVHFVQRDTDVPPNWLDRCYMVERDPGVLDSELMTTDLGQCLVTTAEQTVLDLAHRPNLGYVVEEAEAAMVALLPRCNQETLERLAGQQRLRAALTRVRQAAR